MTTSRLLPDAPAGSSVLLGRDRQLSAVARAVAGVRAGSAQFVLIEGESGFGKSALLRAAASTVALWPTRSAIADENEAELPYGVLNQLLRQIEEEGELHPLLSGGIAPDVSPMVAGAALLNLIDGSEGATCVTIDDAQWLDQRSADALWFAGRRSFRDRLLVLIAARPDETPFLERMRLLVSDQERGTLLRVGGLGIDSVTALVKRRTGHVAPRRLSSALVAATDGNALHLHTILNQAATDVDPLGSLERMLRGTPPAAPGFKMVTLQTVRGLSPAARLALEIVAVLHDTAAITDVVAIAGSAAGIELTGADIDEACSTGLVSLAGDDSAVVMPHERVRAVLVGSLPLQTKQRIHSAAGRLIGGSRGLHHRALAAAGTDAALADELDDAATVAAAEHQVERAFRYARWAARLSSSPQDKERRTIDAGVHAVAARRLDLLATALAEFEALGPGSEREVLLGSAALAVGDVLVASERLELAARSGRIETPRARIMRAVAHQALAELTLIGSQTETSLHHAAAVLDLVSELRRSPAQPGIAGFDLDDVEANAVSWQAVAAWQGGVADPGKDRLDELIAGAQSRGLQHRDAVLLIARGHLRRQQGRLASAYTDLDAGIALADLGRPDLSVYGRIELALACFRDGRWDAAAATATAAASIAEDVANPGLRASAYAVAAFVPAGRGDRQATEVWLAEAESMPEPLRTPGYRRLANFARALLARATGDPATAVIIARRALADDPPHAQIEHEWWRQLLSEALGPPNPPVNDALATLTGREREVAHLAAQGLTNREVAGRLFVSVKGVEYHMGNVLAKLGLSSRRGIRGVIERN